MAKKAKRKAIPTISKEESHTGVTDVPGVKQTAGAVTGAVLGGVVGGPVGALAGGALGAMVGDSSAKGKKPIKRAVDAIREEITSGRAKKRLKDVGERIKSLRSGGQEASTKKAVTKKAGGKQSAGKKKKKSKAAATGAKTKKGSKGAAAGKKKGAKKS